MNSIIDFNFPDDIEQTTFDDFVSGLKKDIEDIELNAFVEVVTKNVVKVMVKNNV